MVRGEQRLAARPSREVVHLAAGRYRRRGGYSYQRGSALFSGVYRGVVMDAADVLQRGRVKVSVPSVAGSGGGQWAPVCYTCNCTWSIQAGATVMVAFEGGSPDRPVVIGQVDA